MDSLPSVQVFQVPLEQCSQLTDCQSCTASPNPLCGWCTVEQKCSRRSQCQNSNKIMRWVEDDAQCISSVITPTQFVLGIGQNVNINTSSFARSCHIGVVLYGCCVSITICDLLCINQPFTTYFSFEKNSCIDFELSLLIDYTSYHYEIFSVASTEQDFYRD